MSAAAWTFLGVALTGIVALIVGYWNSHTKKTEGDEDEDDPFQARYFARMDQIEADLASKSVALTECLVQCARLRSELAAAKAQRKADTETIKRLRARIDHLVEQIRRRDERE